MIDWLGARKPLDIILLMTLLTSLGAAAVERVMPVATEINHAL